MSTRIARALGIGALALVTVGTYGPAFRAGFVWDDRYLAAGPLVVAPDGLSRIWFSAEPRDFFPLSYSAFWGQWHLWGANPAGYHAVNVLLHALNAILVWLVLRRLAIPGAWLCGAVFAVHPLNVESVAWISEQKNTLALLFFLLSVRAWQAAESPGRPWALAASLVLFALSLLAKPLAVTWPVILLGYAAWRRGRIGRLDAAHAGLFFVLSAGVSLITLHVQRLHASAGVSFGPAGLPERIVQAGRSLLFYLGKILFPAPLSAIYGPDDGGWAGPAFVVLAAAAALAVAAHRWYGPGWIRHAAFGLGFYALMLAPVLGLVPTAFLFYAPVCDRWAYAAMLGVLAPLCAGAAGLVGECGRPIRAVGVAAAVLLVGAMAGASMARCAVFRDSEALFADTLAKNPRAWAAYASLGNLAFDRRDLARAEACYRQALALKPDYWEAYNGLGIVFAVRGRPDRAIPFFETTLRLFPGHGVARRNLEQARQDLLRLQGRGAPAAGPDREEADE